MDDRQAVRLLKAIREHSGLELDAIRDAANHGADSGYGGFTYTSDAASFTRDNADLVYEILGEDAEDFGFDSIPEFVASFHRADMADSRDGYDNLLAWYALEAAGRWLGRSPGGAHILALSRARPGRVALPFDATRPGF